MLAERSNPTEQEVYAGVWLRRPTSPKQPFGAAETAVKRAGGKHRWEKLRGAALR